MGRLQKLGQVLRGRGYEKRNNPKNRRVEFSGLKIINRQGAMEALTK